MAPVRAYAYQWKSHSVSGVEERAFARALLQRHDEIGLIVGWASGQRIDRALSGGEKGARSIMAASGALCGGLFVHNLPASRDHCSRVRSGWRMAEFLLLQFYAQYSATS